MISDKVQLLAVLVERGYKQAAKANCHARKWGDIAEGVEEMWNNSNIKKELLEILNE